jgi:nucleoside-diphosphate-sugar epimerase
MGEDDYTGRLKFHVDHIREGKPIYFPDIGARMCFVHAADAALFLSRFIEQEWTGPINCCSKEPIVLREMMAMIEHSLGRKGVFIGKKAEGEHSPYGIEEDSFMSTEKLTKFGFKPSSIADWLPGLIEKIVSS